MLANRTLSAPLEQDRLVEIARPLGSDVPFFLTPGPKLAEGSGERLTPLDLPQDYWIVLALPRGTTKASTAAVYARYDELGGGAAFTERRTALAAALGSCRRSLDLASLPANDLAAAAGRSRVPDALLALGAFRVDLSGAGPAVYGLFERRADAERAARRCRRLARSWVTAPVW